MFPMAASSAIPQPRRPSGSTREQILEAARQAFFEKGYEGCSIRDLERRSGLTRGAIYYHFGGKQEIYVAVLCDGLRLLRADFEAASAGGDADPRSGLAAVVHRYCAFHRTQPQIFQIAQHFFFGSASTGDLDPQLVRDVHTEASRCLEILVALLRNGMDRGVFLDRDPYFEAVLIWSMATNLVQLADESRGVRFLQLSWEEIVERLLESIRDRLCTDPG